MTARPIGRVVSGCLRGLAAGAGAVAASLPGPAVACSVCFWGKSNSMIAYVGTAVLLSVLPLAMTGAVGLWLYRQTRTHRGTGRGRAS